MKAQNCPLCGNKAEWKTENFLGCSDKKNKMYNCSFSYAQFSEVVWNKIRIAPDGKDVMTFPVREKDCLYINDTPKAVWEANWMNPHYPREATNEID